MQSAHTTPTTANTHAYCKHPATHAYVEQAEQANCTQQMPGGCQQPQKVQPPLPQTNVCTQQTGGYCEPKGGRHARITHVGTQIANRTNSSAAPGVRQRVRRVRGAGATPAPCIRRDGKNDSNSRMCVCVCVQQAVSQCADQGCQ